jgi:hypothetical protein
LTLVVSGGQGKGKGTQKREHRRMLAFLFLLLEIFLNPAKQFLPAFGGSSSGSLTIFDL